MKIRCADVRLFGRVPRVYSQKVEMTGYPASWMAPIGGILARMTPKHRSEIKLDDKVRPEKDAVIVSGRVTPNVGGQEVRVDMTRPDGEVEVTAAKSAAAGRFSAAVDLRAKGRKRGAKPRGDVYAFQAHIVNAAVLAPADSNIVWFKAVDQEKVADREAVDEGRIKEKPPPGTPAPDARVALGRSCGANFHCVFPQ